ncbi:CYTH domain-containing protein [Flavobacterium pallidum]|uniref:Adenylate cyclase n=1 Tax=Flavobacterium pallidum TaxID=2172098 RepID=A0A2S1SLG4_9FLAO|nr:CYTH domain-containing protein [Flavobacterium pallidum]AWI27192.1 adenylate cyclase [Flavobacterium pallidum]
MIEIERKFLVISDEFKEQAFAKNHIAQGYLNSHPERTVRIRIKGEIGFLTIKGKGNESGTTRLEWETELSLMDAKPLLALCENGMIDKTRYEVNIGKHIFEVDEFHGENDGLLIAEIELRNENELFEKPDWLGKEVTGDEKYYNAYLSKNPYAEWKNKH